MKKRHIKKYSNKARTLLIQLGMSEKSFAKNEDSEWDDYPKGVWEVWYRTSYEYDEWDAITAYEELVRHIEGVLTVEEIDFDTFDIIVHYSPDVSSALKVFKLAKQLVKEVV